MPTRRGFLGALLAGAALDPDRALWVPGARLISIPPQPLIPRYAVLFLSRLGTYKPGDNVWLDGQTYTVVEKHGGALRLVSSPTERDHAMIKAYWNAEYWRVRLG